jgi:hypothetical protein
MDWKKLACCAVISGASMGLIGCGGDDVPPVETMDPVTRTYVLSTISIPEVMGSGAAATAAGFNLDGMVSTGTGSTCVDLTPDYLSLNDPGETGVDNALAGLVPTLEMLIGGEGLDATLQEQITEGTLLIMMQVRDINSFTNDSSIQVQLYLGSVPGGGAPGITGSTLTPGQAFTGMPVGTVQTGSIVSGRMRVSTPLLTIGINTDSLMLDLNIRSAQVRATIRTDSLSNGAIGGALRVEEIADAAEAIMPGLRATVLSVLGGVADLEPQAADPLTCDSLSTGILFTAVSATLAE